MKTLRKRAPVRDNPPVKGRKRAPGGGRKPAKIPSGSLTLWVRAPLRQALEEAAIQQGCSLNEEVTRRLERSISDTETPVYGPPHVRSLAVLLAQLVHGIESTTGETWRRDAYTFAAIQSVLKPLLMLFGPRDQLTGDLSARSFAGQPQPMTPEQLGAQAVASLLFLLHHFRRPPAGDIHAVLHNPNLFAHLTRDLALDHGENRNG